MALGTVKWFSEEKGFGFVTPDEGDRDVFVHFSAITGMEKGKANLDQGQRVSYDIEHADKGDRCTNVVVLPD